MRVRAGIAWALALLLLLWCSACTGPGLEPPSGMLRGPRQDADSRGSKSGEAERGAAGAAATSDAVDQDGLDAGVESEHTNGDAAP